MTTPRAKRRKEEEEREAARVKDRGRVRSTREMEHEGDEQRAGRERTVWAQRVGEKG